MVSGRAHIRVNKHCLPALAIVQTSGGTTPPPLRIGRDQTVANFGARHKQRMTPRRSFGHFFHPPSAALPASYNGTPMSQILDTGSLWATTTQECYLSKCPEGSADHRAQRDDGDRHALPSRHRRSQAAAAPAAVAAWQATCACVSPTLPACYTPDTPTLRCSRSILRAS